MTAFVVVLHGWLHRSQPAQAKLPLLAGAVYTAVLAPFVVGALQRGKRVFAFQSARRRIRAW